MLVLSRQLNESIIIGQDVTVRVLEIQGDSVKIGIEAPRDIPIYRSELYEEIKAENIAAMQLKPEAMKDLANQMRTKKRAATSDSASEEDS